MNTSFPDNFSITSKNVIFSYFSMLRREEVRSILDVGLFLERIGAICRTVGDLSIDDGLPITGWSFPEEPVLPLYDTVYTELLTADETLKKRYDLAMMLCLKPFRSSCDGRFFQKVFCAATEIFTDRETFNCFSELRKMKDITPLHIDMDEFFLIRTGG